MGAYPFDLGLVSLFRRQEKQRRQRPNAKNQTAQGPEPFRSAALAGHDKAEDRVEKVHQNSSVQQRETVHVGFDEKQTGEIAEDMVEIHEPPLTLPSVC